MAKQKNIIIDEHDEHDRPKTENELRYLALAASVAKTEAQTAKLTRENEIAAGRMIARSDVIEDASSVAIALCQDLQRIPARMAARLVGLEAAEIKHELEVEIAAALDNFRVSAYGEINDAVKNEVAQHANNNSKSKRPRKNLER